MPKLSYLKTKFPGVYKQNLKNDVSFSIAYQDENHKVKRKSLGRQSQGISAIYCANEREKIIASIRNNTLLPDSVKKKSIVTLRQVIELFFLKKESQRKTKILTISSTRDNLKEIKSIILNTFKNLLDKNLHKLQEEDFTACLTSKSQSSINKRIPFMKNILKFAVEKKMIEQNVLADVKFTKATNGRTRYLSKDEIKILLDHVSNDKQLYLFVLLSISTGARLKTICNIQKKHIKENKIILYNFKAHRTYEAFIPDNIKLLIEKNGSIDFVFSENSRQIQRKLQKILDFLFNENYDSTDLDKVVIHTLRHTFASHLVINNVPIFTVMKLLDHTEIKDTIRYAKLADTSKQEAVNELIKKIL